MSKIQIQLTLLNDRCFKKKLKIILSLVLLVFKILKLLKEILE